MWSDLIQSMSARFYGMYRWLPVLGLAMAGVAAPAAAAPIVKTEHVEAALISEFTSAQPGKPVHVGLRLRMVPHWHTYWKNPGDSGLPTKINWRLPAGWKAGEIQWPYPKHLPVGPLMNYGYEDEVVLLVPITPAADAKPGSYPIKANAEWLVCKDICIPEKGELDLTLAVANGTPAPNPRNQAHIERAQGMLPVAAPGWKFASGTSGKTLVVRATAPAGAALPEKVAFFPEREQLIEPAAPQKVTREGATLVIEMRMVEPAPAIPASGVAGVLVSERGWPGLAKKAVAVDAPFTGPMAPAAAASVADDGGIGGSALAALAFALM